MSILRAILSPRGAPSLAEAKRAAESVKGAEGGWRLRGGQPLTGSSASPVVSVVTVAFNSARTIAETIASVRAQTYRPVEYVVIDGGSRDGTVDILRENEDLIAYWRSAPDAGIYDAFNQGIALSTGDAIQIINSDDWMEPDQLARAVATLSASGADFVHGDIWLHGWQGRDVRVCGDPDWAMRAARSMPTIHQATVLARRETYERLGLFRTDLRIASDYDWFIRAARAWMRGVHDSSVVAHMRAGGASTTRQRRTIAEGFACAYSNGDALWPCARHWSGRWIWPNGVPAWASALVRTPGRVGAGAASARGRARRLAMSTANAVPALRRLPGRAAIKRLVGMREPTRGALPTRAALEQFVAVRDMGAGLAESSIEELLRRGAAFGRVAVIAASARAHQAAEALRRAGATVVPAATPDEAIAAGCRSALLDAGESGNLPGDTSCDADAALRRWSAFPILLIVRDFHVEVRESDGEA